MAVITEGGLTHLNEEIEPFCRWRRTEEIDIVELHLPPGRCPMDQTKPIKFKKETKVAKNCKRNEIRAKFSKGVLYVTMPKTSPIAVAPYVPFQGNTSGTRDRHADDDASNITKYASEFHSKFESLREKLWRKTVFEGMAAVVVVAAGVVGAVKAYQYFMASPV
ncbi:uncharacterized protein LOC108852536 isoform X2 [Raphanus sativus]|uniref:Uncharacterized protein LOC108852536 isoform X2 n=1 Tax=Raphanus sativus TaxID=3726 RepID=A0A6J0NAM8_RAPSA|nr:uncharacterized protein LOC108852536 isoform X2 [Raphanus sativus]